MMDTLMYLLYLFVASWNFGLPIAGLKSSASTRLSSTHLPFRARFSQPSDACGPPKQRPLYLPSRRSAVAAAAMGGLSYPDPTIFEAKGEHKATVIILHGLGDTAAGWASMAGMFSIPGVKFVFPTAPMVRMNRLTVSASITGHCAAMRSSILSFYPSPHKIFGMIRSCVSVSSGQLLISASSTEFFEDTSIDVPIRFGGCSSTSHPGRARRQCLLPFGKWLTRDL